jgi:hypothetical protein
MAEILLPLTVTGHLRRGDSVSRILNLVEVVTAGAVRFVPPVTLAIFD